MISSPNPPEPRSLVIAPGRVFLGAGSDATQGDDATMVQTMLQNRGLVLAVLFLVTGVLGVTLLWRCQRFTAWERWFWAVAVALYTLGWIFVAEAAVQKSLEVWMPSTQMTREGGPSHQKGEVPLRVA